MKTCTLIVFTLAACTEPPWPDVTPSPAPPPPPPQVTSAADAAATPTAVVGAGVELAPEVLGALRPILVASDRIHDALARDTTEGVPAAGVAIADIARAVRAQVGDATVQALLADVETRARALGKAEAIEPLRLAYGELSKPLVALVTSVPALREGRHVFMCPMARGYQKWLQSEPSLRNPYFGASMLTCGEASDWSP